jgi:histone deacetylase 1/2
MKGKFYENLSVSMDCDHTTVIDVDHEEYQEYAPDTTIPLIVEETPLNEYVQPTQVDDSIPVDDNIPINYPTFPTDDQLRDADVNELHTAASTPHPDEPTHPYSTRLRTRGTRPQWDYQTHRLINGDVMLTKSTSYTNKDYVYNISVKKALATMPKAIKSIYKELVQMVDKKVFQGVKPTFKHQKKVIKSFLFLKEKFTAAGVFDKLKSRLVAGGHMQDRDSILYEDISSPTASIPFLFIIACIAAKQHRKVKTIDIGGAYLNADISKHDILMELNETIAGILVTIDPSYEQYLRSNGTMVVKLNRALYGCIESAKLWNDLLSSTLISDGFTCNPLDKCIFNKQVDGEQITVVVYVDDLFITSMNNNLIDQLESLLKDKFNEITVNDGVVHSYLGMIFDFSIPGDVKITMDGYVNDLLKQADISGTVSTPATENLFITRELKPLDEDTKSKFHTMVAKLLYLSKRVRPDILLAVSFLTTRVQNPDSDDLNKLTRVIKYLNGSRELGLVLRASEPLTIKAYIDAAYGLHQDGKSHSGLIISIGSGAVSSKSTKQKLVTKSSTESELVATSDFASEALCSVEFLKAQGEIIDKPIIFQDNQSTIQMIHNGGSKSDRTRHVNIRYFWIKERVDADEVILEYLPTDQMIADILTKPLQGSKFAELRAALLNWYV